MNYYPDQGMTFNEMVLRSIRLYYVTLKHIALSVLLLVLLKIVMVLAAPFFPEKIAEITAPIVATLVSVYLLSVSLLSAHQVFLDHPEPLSTVFLTVFKQLKIIYSALILYLVGSVVVFYLVKFFLIAAERLINQPSPVHTGVLLIGFCFVLVYFAIFAFVIPLCLLDKMPLFSSFRESLFLTEKNKLSVLMLFVIGGMITFIVSPGALHEQWLHAYHLSWLFDLIALFVFTPLFVNLFLLIINDSKRKFVLR